MEANEIANTLIAKLAENPQNSKYGAVLKNDLKNIFSGVQRVSGDEAISISNKIFKGKDLNKVESHTINYGHIVDNDKVIDEVIKKGKVNPGDKIYAVNKDKAVALFVMGKNKLEDGMKILATWYISVYERDGSYQLYIDSVELDGIGNLYIQYNKLKEKKFYPTEIGIETNKKLQEVLKADEED